MDYPLGSCISAEWSRCPALEESSWKKAKLTSSSPSSGTTKSKNTTLNIKNTVKQHTDKFLFILSVLFIFILWFIRPCGSYMSSTWGAICDPIITSLISQSIRCPTNILINQKLHMKNEMQLNIIVLHLINMAVWWRLFRQALLIYDLDTAAQWNPLFRGVTPKHRIHLFRISYLMAKKK